MSKQSSIDWLYNTIDYEIVSYLDGEIDLNELSIAMLKIKEQAKAMHRKEIEEAYVYGVAFQIDIKNGLSPIFYYNDRFGGDK